VPSAHAHEDSLATPSVNGKNAAKFLKNSLTKLMLCLKYCGAIPREKAGQEGGRRQRQQKYKGMKQVGGDPL